MRVSNPTAAPSRSTRGGPSSITSTAATARTVTIPGRARAKLRPAMTVFEHTEQIDRPVEEVFAFLAEPANLPRWQMSLIAVRPHRRGPLRPGVEVTETRRFLGRTRETHLGLHRASAPAAAR